MHCANRANFFRYGRPINSTVPSPVKASSACIGASQRGTTYTSTPLRSLLRAPSWADTLPLDLPPAIAKTDEFFGDVSVYYDEVDLQTLSGWGWRSIADLGRVVPGLRRRRPLLPARDRVSAGQCRQRLGLSSFAADMTARATRSGSC